MTDNSDGGEKTSFWGSRRAPITPSVRAPQPAPPQPAIQPGPQAADGRSYQAFETQERALRLNIRCARGPSRYPAYAYLLDIIYDYDFAESFTLVFTFMAVMVKGKHLDAVVHAIEHGSCVRITEYHPRKFDRPSPDAPFIESIEIVAAERAAAAEDKDAERSAR